MSPTLMRDLENRGLIFGLSPDKYDMHPPEGEVAVKTIYQSDTKYGSHMLVMATLNRLTFTAFGAHPDNEEVFLIGKPGIKPCFFLFGLTSSADLERKADQETLSPEDFIAFKGKFNDPYLSFFSIKKGVPHGEITTKGRGDPPSFFVTEQSELPLEKLNLGLYEIILDE